MRASLRAASPKGRLLGAKESELEPPFDASTFVVDDEYLILDLVLNWVGQMLVYLCSLAQVADGILLGPSTLTDVC